LPRWNPHAHTDSNGDAKCNSNGDTKCHSDCDPWEAYTDGEAAADTAPSTLRKYRRG